MNNNQILNCVFSAKHFYNFFHVNVSKRHKKCSPLCVRYSLHLALTNWHTYSFSRKFRKPENILLTVATVACKPKAFHSNKRNIRFIVFFFSVNNFHMRLCAYAPPEIGLAMQIGQPTTHTNAQLQRATCIWKFTKKIPEKWKKYSLENAFQSCLLLFFPPQCYGRSLEHWRACLVLHISFAHCFFHSLSFFLFLSLSLTLVLCILTHFMNAAKAALDVYNSVIRLMKRIAISTIAVSIWLTTAREALLVAALWERSGKCSMRREVSGS